MENEAEKNKQPLLNIFVNNLTMENTIREIRRILTEGEPSYLVEVNVDVLLKADRDPHLKKIVDEADIALVDGQPLCWAARYQGCPVKEKVSGSDLIPQLCRWAARRGNSIFIMGGQPGVPELAARNLCTHYPKLCVAGVYAPPFGFERDPSELQKIDEILQKASPDLLFVCLGCPKQEYWVYDHFKKCGAKMTICAGATVDFLAGRIKRAPKWMSRCGLEWFYRFLKEPKRLFRRYFVEDFWGFVWLLWKYGKRI